MNEFLIDDGEAWSLGTFIHVVEERPRRTGIAGGVEKNSGSDLGIDRGELLIGGKVGLIFYLNRNGARTCGGQTGSEGDRFGAGNFLEARD